jgi:nucleoside-diphosphate-sugar epimerase
MGGHVLVTGARGFIGSNLVEYLVPRGSDVRAFVRYHSRNDYGRLETCPPEILAACGERSHGSRGSSAYKTKIYNV